MKSSPLPLVKITCPYYDKYTATLKKGGFICEKIIQTKKNNGQHTPHTVPVSDQKNLLPKIIVFIKKRNRSLVLRSGPVSFMGL